MRKKWGEVRTDFETPNSGPTGKPLEQGFKESLRKKHKIFISKVLISCIFNIFNFFYNRSTINLISFITDALIGIQSIKNAFQNE